MRTSRPGLIAFLAAFLALAGQIGFGVAAAQATPALAGVAHIHICGAAAPGHTPDGPVRHTGACASCVLCAASLLQTTLPTDTSAVPMPRMAAILQPRRAIVAEPPPEQPRAAQPRGPPT